MVRLLKFLHLESLPLLDLMIHLESCERFVTSPVVVQSQGEVPFDLLLPDSGDVGHPLLQALSLKTQEPEDGGVSRHLAQGFVVTDCVSQVMEPTSLQHQPLDLLALFLLEACCSV